MRTISLFNGISCFYVAPSSLGIKPSLYISSEIDPAAIRVSGRNHPNLITEVGDVTRVTRAFTDIDLLVGGSPCQGFSYASSSRLNLLDVRSALFFEYLRIRDLVKPTYFLLENVVMDSTVESVITSYMGVSPRLVDAVSFTGQSRPRLFWTNLPSPTLPAYLPLPLAHLWFGASRGNALKAVMLNILRYGPDTYLIA